MNFDEKCFFSDRRVFDFSRDTTQLIMKSVMHELDYDMDDNDLKFLHELNESNKTKSNEKRREKKEKFVVILDFV